MKQLLTKLLDYLTLYKHWLIKEQTGLCGLIERMFFEGILTEEESVNLEHYIMNHKPENLDKSCNSTEQFVLWHFAPGEYQARQNYLQQQIESFKSN